MSGTDSDGAGIFSGQRDHVSDTEDSTDQNPVGAVADQIDDRMYLWKHRDAVRAMLGVDVVSSCWLHLSAKVSFPGYLLGWEFLLATQGAGEMTDDARVIASMILDVTRIEFQDPMNSCIADRNMLRDWLKRRAKGGGNFVANPMWARLVDELENLDPSERTPSMTSFLGLWRAHTGVVDSTFLDTLLPDFSKIISEHSETLRKVYFKMPSKEAANRFLSGLVILACRGSMTRRHCDKVSGGFEAPYALNTVLTPDIARDTYRILRALFPAGRSLKVFFNTLKTLFPEDIHLRMSLVFQQASHAGVSSLTLTMQAIRSSEDCLVWSYLQTNAAAEWNAFVKAVRICAEDPYAGFDLGAKPNPAIRATLYPSLVFAGLQLLQTLNPESTSKGYRGTQDTVLKGPIVTFIQKYALDRAQKAVDTRMAVVPWDQVFRAAELNIGV